MMTTDPIREHYKRLSDQALREQGVAPVADCLGDSVALLAACERVDAGRKGSTLAGMLMGLQK